MVELSGSKGNRISKAFHMHVSDRPDPTPQQSWPVLTQPF